MDIPNAAWISHGYRIDPVLHATYPKTTPAITALHVPEHRVDFRERKKHETPEQEFPPGII
jgi:hypothetical protein